MGDDILLLRYNPFFASQVEQFFVLKNIKKHKLFSLIVYALLLIKNMYFITLEFVIN